MSSSKISVFMGIGLLALILLIGTSEAGFRSYGGGFSAGGYGGGLGRAYIGGGQSSYGGSGGFGSGGGYGGGGGGGGGGYGGGCPGCGK